MWKPSKSQRKAFAIRMQTDSEYAEAYHARQKARIDKCQASSQFNYESRGGMYIPTQAQHDFCFNNMNLFVTDEQKNAANMVMYGWSCQERIHHDYIHVVNEVIRQPFN